MIIRGSTPLVRIALLGVGRIGAGHAAALAADPAARIHLYGKQWRPGRKLGHVNVTVPGDPCVPPAPEAVDEALRRARAVVAVLRGEA